MRADERRNNGLSSDVQFELPADSPRPSPGATPWNQQCQERAILYKFALTLAFAAPTLAVALLSGSMLLLSDMLDYIREIIISLVGWCLLRNTRLKKIVGFDYGTGKLQTAISLFGSLAFMATLLLMTGLAVNSLLHPHPLNRDFSLVGLLFQVVGFIGYGWVWMHSHRIAVREPSPFLDLQWRSARADALACLSILLCLAFTLLLGGAPWAIYLDPMFALLFILYAGASFLPHISRCLLELTDKTIQEELQLRIDRHLAANFNGYAGFHGVRTRHSGGRILIEIELSFPHEETVGEAVTTVESLRQGIEADITNSEVSVILRPADAAPCGDGSHEQL